MDRLPRTLLTLAATAMAVFACGRPRPPAPPPPAVLDATLDRPNTPPVITVSGNAPEGEVVYGTIVDLVATCTDREDGALGALRWTSDRGDWLADGSTLRFMPEPGRYIVRATCTDQARAATTVAATGPFTVVDRWSAADSIPVTVTVPFATNRGGAPQPRAPGAGFDGSPGDSLVRGFLTVNVPARDFRVAGFAQRTPFMHSVRGNFASGDATRRWIRDIGAADSIGFVSRLAEAFTHGEEDEVIVFVHGYRTRIRGERDPRRATRRRAAVRRRDDPLRLAVRRAARQLPERPARCPRRGTLSRPAPAGAARGEPSAPHHHRRALAWAPKCSPRRCRSSRRARARRDSRRSSASRCATSSSSPPTSPPANSCSTCSRSSTSAPSG